MIFFDLTQNDSLESLESKSKDKLQIILKHSTRCIVSTMALRTLQQCDEDAVCWVLDLLNNRDISKEIADRYKILHESPQIIVLLGGQVHSHASHEKITCEFIKHTHAK
jgi:bacillithiol system protein YtxJ